MLFFKFLSNSNQKSTFDSDFFLLAIKNVVGFLCVGVVVENDGIVYIENQHPNTGYAKK